MCECGCGESLWFTKLPAPDGDVYAIEIYPGCRYCESPAGVGIARLSRKQLEEMEVTDLPDLPLHHVEDGWDDHFFPVITPEALHATLKEVVEDEFAVTSSAGEIIAAAAGQTLASYHTEQQHNKPTERQTV